MEDQNIKNILTCIKQQDYKNALDIIKVTKGHDAITKLLKTFCLSELENFIEAEKIINEIEDVSRYFNTVIYRNMNMIEKLKKYLFNDKEYYEYCVLQGDYLEANIYAQRLSSIHRILSAVMLGTKCINRDLQTINFNPNLLIFLHRKKAVDINDYIFSINMYDGHFFTLIKEMYVEQNIHKSVIERIMRDNGTKYEDDEGFLNFLVEKIDDWSLYEIALEKNFNLTKTTSSNYKRYIMEKDRNIDSIKDCVYTMTDFTSIAKLFDKFDLQDFIKDNFNILQRHLKGKEDVNDINDMYLLFRKSQNLLNLKILLSMLISTQNESNLLFAYFMCGQYKSAFAEQYEIKVIHLFLARFFCDFEQVKKSLEELDVKNVLLEKLSYVWSDIYIKFRSNQKVYNCLYEWEEKHYNWNRSTIKQINNVFMRFIDNGYLQHAIELLETRKRLMNDIVMAELEQKQLFSTKSDKYMEGILAKQTDYLFVKCTNQNNFNHFQLANIYKTIPHNKNIINPVIFNNDYENITNKEFINSILKLQIDLVNK